MRITYRVGCFILLLAAGCVRVDAPLPRNETPAVKPVTVEPSKPAATDQQTDARTEAPAATTAAKPPAEPPGRKPAARTGVAKKEPAPALDLTALETRLKETRAIGVFTKITLKNQVDDLLEQFRAYYQGRVKTTLAELRQPYERLLLKVLSLLQDGDPELARAIVSSREAIWGILADPNKFAAL